MAKLRFVLMALSAMSVLLVWCGLTWSAKEWNFGRVNEEAGEVVCRFGFCNSGADSVVIRKVRSSCGCTTVDYPRGKIAPGDSAFVTVAYDPAMRPGKFDRKVLIYADDGKYQLRVTGTVVPSEETAVQLFPERYGQLRLGRRMVYVGDVKQGYRRIGGVTGYNSGRDTLHVAFGKLPEAMTVVAEPAIVAPGELFRVSVAYSAAKDAEIGVVELPVTIMSNGVESGEIAVIARIMPGEDSPAQLRDAPMISLATKRIDLSPLSRKKPKRVDVAFRNVGRSDLHLSGVSGIDSSVRVIGYDRIVTPGKEGRITLEADAAAVEGGAFDSIVALMCNDPLAMTVRIRLVGLIEE